ncbi:hypothetical protein N431DRAFT_526012 [Stipitochalara longipes BDJ]|nr:hypothetical protein N431DRAFT_526012 [Stipitochalara longipes BDJ]
MPPQPSVKFIEDLSSRDTERLAKVLSLGWRTKISLQWLSEQNSIIQQLPSTLRKPEGIFSKVAMSLPRAPQKAVLCSSHKGLNPLLVRRFFIQLSAECTVRLVRLDESSHLPPNVSAFLKRIHGINSLWFSAGIHRSMFNLPHDEKCHEMIDGGCEACILSVVGTNHEILRDLRASMLGRRKKGLPVPRLLKIVDAWIEGTDHGIAIRKDSDSLEKEIRECRRQMQKARQKQPLLEPHDEEVIRENNFEMDEKEKDEDAEHYFGTSILDYYTGGLRSSTNQSRAPTPIPSPEDVHPAFRSGLRESMLSFDVPIGTFRRHDTAPSPPSRAADRDSWETDVRTSRAPSCAAPPPPPRPRTAYTASIYSRNQFGDPATVPSSIPDVPSIPDTYADEQAKTYKKLMGIEEGDEESERQSRNSRVSKWMNGD